MVPLIEGVDHLIEVTRTKDVGLIKDDTNLIAQQRAPQPEVRLPSYSTGMPQSRVSTKPYLRRRIPLESPVELTPRLHHPPPALLLPFYNHI